MEPPEFSLGQIIRRTAARLDTAVAAALAPQGLTTNAWLLLRLLHDRGPIAPSALADEAAVTRGAVTKLVDRLRARRLVVRAAAGRADTRYRTIALTGAGVVLVRELVGVVAAAEADALSGKERSELLRVLAGN